MINQRNSSEAPTLREIAESCGVAISTVSRAFSDPQRVGPATRNKILATARELGYSHSNSRSGVRGTVALLVPGLSNPFILDLVRGVQSRVNAAGCQLVLVSTDESQQKEMEQLSLLAQTAAGIIAAAPRSSDLALQQISARVPLVVVNREVPDVSSVLVDTASAMSQAIDHLAHQGHRTIAYVRGPVTSWTDQARYQELSRAAKACGVECLPIGNYYPSLEAGEAAADVLHMSGATAAVFFNDLMAIGALMRLKALGVAVPADLSIVGCDDIFGSQFCEPPLTTFRSPLEMAGAEASDLITSGTVQRGRPPQSVRIPAHLIVRSSTSKVTAGRVLPRTPAGT